MRFYPLTAVAREPEALQAEYREGREIGRIRLGAAVLFFRSRRKVFYIPYTEIRRYFRRVLLVPAKMCCGRGNFQMEHLVLCGDEGELAQIELPGTQAAKVLMECLGELAPDAAAGSPPRTDAADDREGPGSRREEKE